MPSPGDIVEGEITRFTNSGNAVITVNSHEYLLIDDTPPVHGAGDPLTVRVLNSRWASKPSWRANLIGERQGYEGEFYTTVKRLTNRRNVFVEAYSANRYAGEALFAGAVRATVDAPVPVIPLSESLSDQFRQVVVCTDPSLWDGDYFARLSKAADTTLTALTNLKSAFRNGDPITTTEILASELQEKDKLEIDDSRSYPLPKTPLTADEEPVDRSKKQDTDDSPEQLPDEIDRTDITEAKLDTLSRQKTVVTIDGDKYSLNADSRQLQGHNPGDTVKVRVVDSSEAVLELIDNQPVAEKQGYRGERYVQVYDFTSSGNARLIGVEDGQIGQKSFTGELDCSIGAYVPVLPMSSGSDEGQVVVCTDPSLWDEGYEETIANLTSLPLAWGEDLRKAFTGQTNLAESYVAGHLEHYRGPVVTGEIIRFSNNDNAVISIESEEYVLKGETEKDVGDKIRVRFGNNTFVTAGDVEPGPQEENSAGGDSEGSEKKIASSTEPETSPDTEDDTASQTLEEESSGIPVPEPDLTDDDMGYTETRRRERDPSFTEDVRSAYNERCAVCGERRVTPDGSPEVEAAHIYPKSEGGVDDVQNGVALCKLHHWAFDAGWISFTDNYEIIVREASNRAGYNEFADLEGQSLYLPEDDELRPHPKFIRSHRDLHGFEK